LVRQQGLPHVRVPISTSCLAIHLGDHVKTAICDHFKNRPSGADPTRENYGKRRWASLSFRIGQDCSHKKMESIYAKFAQNWRHEMLLPTGPRQSGFVPFSA
jgi:hypothetical protein